MTLVLGEKKGTEIYYDPSGNKEWTWKHDDKGASTWVRYYPNGVKKTESTWVNKNCNGTAYEWDKNGKLSRQAEFWNGRGVKRNVK